MKETTKMRSHFEEDRIGVSPHTLHQNKFQTDQKFKHKNGWRNKTQTVKLREKAWQNVLIIFKANGLLSMRKTKKGEKGW